MCRFAIGRLFCGSSSYFAVGVKTSDEHITGYDSLRVRKTGSFLNIDLQLQVTPYISVSHAHQVGCGHFCYFVKPIVRHISEHVQISENLRHGMFRQIEGVAEVHIHIDTAPHDHLARPMDPASPTSDTHASIVRAAVDGFEHDVKRVSHVTTHYLKVR